MASAVTHTIAIAVGSKAGLLRAGSNLLGSGTTDSVRDRYDEGSTVSYDEKLKRVRAMVRDALEGSPGTLLGFNPHNLPGMDRRTTDADNLLPSHGTVQSSMSNFLKQQIKESAGKARQEADNL